MELKLAGRTALITGASKGIGLGIARRFAAEGCHLVLTARSQAALEVAAASLRTAGAASVRTLALDLAEAAPRDALVAAAPDIDILVNNAGAIPGGGILDIDDTVWRRSWELKVFGYINLTRAYFRLMSARRRGVIINIVGSGGERLDAGYIAGSTGNAALMAFSRALGAVSINAGVRVIAINPGPVETDRIITLSKDRARRDLGDESRWREAFAKLPYGRPAAVDEIAPMAVFLASDLANYISGTVVTIDGGIGNRP